MSNGIFMVLGLALLPALGNFGGGLLAEWRQPSRQTLTRALHAAKGIILAVIAVEVMPEALGAAAPWLLALAFLAGGGTYLLVQSGIERWQQSKQGAREQGRGWFTWPLPPT
jgi:zinc transporter, ZIP family